MIIRIIRYFHGYVKIVMEGYAPERFLNLCANRRILVWDLTRQKEAYTCCITLKDFFRLQPITQKTKTTIHILEKHGFFLFLRFLKRRKVFFFGIATSLGLLVALSFFIWDITISGNLSHTDEELLTFLREQKISVGSAKHSLDGEEIVRLLRTNYSDIVWVSVQIKGTRLFIDLRESETETEEKNLLESEEASDLIAEQSGTVTAIVTRQGTPMVKVGDEVEAGQLLVQGRLEIKNDNGEIAAYQYCHADADIDITSTLPYLESFSIAHQEKNFTENKRKHLLLFLFGKQINLGRKVPFEHYDSKIINYPLRLGKNLYLPFSFSIETFQEYTLENAKYEKETAINLAKEKLEHFCENLTEKGVQILENNVKIECDSMNCISSGNLVILNRVQKRQKTEIIEIPKEEDIPNESVGNSD